MLKWQKENRKNEYPVRVLSGIKTVGKLNTEFHTEMNSDLFVESPLPVLMKMNAYIRLKCFWLRRKSGSEGLT